MGSELTVRAYFAPTDYEMIVEWWEAHGHPVLPDYLLSPVGFIASRDGFDLVAVFVYFDRNTPVCFAERLVSLPGLSVAEVVRATDAAGKEAMEFCRSCGYKLFCVRTPRAIARFIAHAGFSVDEREIVNLSCPLEEPSCLGPQ
jgi:hypothetical protein